MALGRARTAVRCRTCPDEEMWTGALLSSPVRPLCTLFSGEARQELTKRLCSGPFGASFKRVVAASQPSKKWLAVAINLPAPSPRLGVRLPHDDMIFGDRLHATIVRQSSIACKAGGWPQRRVQCTRGQPDHRCKGTSSPVAVSSKSRRLSKFRQTEPKATRFRPFRWAGRHPCPVTSVYPHLAALKDHPEDTFLGATDPCPGRQMERDLFRNGQCIMRLKSAGPDPPHCRRQSR
jgi:hypothetical protein